MNLALLGFGVVGSGVYEWCRDREDLNVTRVLVRSPKPAVADISTTDFNDIVTDPAIDLVAEVMGGLHPAYALTLSHNASGSSGSGFCPGQ